MTTVTLKKDTRTKEDRTPTQTVIQQIAFWTSESDGGNGFSIDPLKDGKLVVSQTLMLSLATKAATALMQHPEAEEDESHAASYIIKAWLKDVEFIRNRATSDKPFGNMFVAFDALDEHHAKRASDHLYMRCHRRNCIAEFLVAQWDKSRKQFLYLTT